MESSVANLPQMTAVGGGKLLFAFLLCFTVAVYARPEDMFPALLPFHFTLTFGICSGLAYVVPLLKGKTRVIWTRELQIVLLLTVWYIAGIPWAYWRTGSLMVFEQVWLKTLLAFFLLAQILVSLSRIRKLLWAIIFSELAVAIFTLFLDPRARWVGDRLFGVNQGILGWNFIGVAISITLPYIAVLFVCRSSLLNRGLLLSTLASMLWMLVLTASRGGLLNVFLSVLLTVVLVLRVASRRRIVIGVLGFGLLAACFLAPRTLWERLGTLWGETKSSSVAASAEESTEQRITLLNRSLEYTRQHPIFGLGLGNFSALSGTETHTDWLETHNTFTQIAAETGIPALVLVVALLIVVLRRMNAVGKMPTQSDDENEVRLLARATQVSIVSFVLGCFFVSMAYDYYLFYLVAVAIGIQAVASKTRPPSPGWSYDSPSGALTISSVENR
jgi:putative inorganic carbon (hco3(-)) transporter